MIESLLGDKTCSWVRIVNGIKKYVAETSEEAHVANIGEKSTGKLVVKAGPRQTSHSTLSPVSDPHRARVKKRFQYCVNPNSPEHFLYLRAIQGHSGGLHVDPTLQDNVLLPGDFAEHIYHVGNSHDLHSIIQSGLIRGGKSIKKGRHAVFFTAVNPMFVDKHKEVEYDLTKPQDCSVQ